MGQGIFLGEAYLPLQEICEDENMDRELTELPQLQLPLTRPQDQGDSRYNENNELTEFL